MFSFMLKFSITFLVSFVILSFQVNNKTIFAHLNEITGPIGQEVQSSIQKSVNRSYQKSKKISKEFLENSDPKYFDSVNSSRSSTEFKKSHGMVLEQLENDDVQKLDKVIKNN